MLNIFEFIIIFCYLMLFNIKLIIIINLSLVNYIILAILNLFNNNWKSI